MTDGQVSNPVVSHLVSVVFELQKELFCSFRRAVARVVQSTMSRSLRCESTGLIVRYNFDE